MQLEELRTFVTLAEVKNFTKTANKLLMSQPTVSLHIKNLEKEFETELFQRSPKFLKITPSGELLLDRANEIIKIYEKTKRDISEIHHSVKGKLKIGASFTIGEYILPSVLLDLQHRYPELEIDLLVGSSNEILQNVRQNQVDVGLVEIPCREKDLLTFPFLDDELSIVCSTNHPLSYKQTVTKKDLQLQTWITREAGSGSHECLKRFIYINELKVKSMLTISSVQAIKEAVKNGVGLSLLSNIVIERDLKEEKLMMVQFKNQSFKRQLSYIYTPMMKDKKNVRVFIDALEDKWGN